MRIVFVADNFTDKYIGGSEFSIQTHINSCPFSHIEIKSNELNLQQLNKETDFLVFGNFTALPHNVFLEVQSGWRYVVEECDYKYCLYRSSHKHRFFAGRDCDCHLHSGLEIQDFFMNALYLFWKSEKQRDEYSRLFPKLRKVQSEIMGGVFSDVDLNYILSLKNKRRDNKYFVLKSDSWIKGSQDAIDYCHKNKMRFRLVGNVPYHKVLRKMAKSKGIVYLPRGFDPSCRMITEAKLLGIEIITNDLVQHTKENWFNNGEKGMLEFLKSRNAIFWKVLYGYLVGKS